MASSSVLRESELAELKRSVLESTRVILVRDVNPINFLPFLRSRSVVDARENDLIKKCCSNSVMEGADKLIDVLCTKGDKGYDEFCKAILHGETQIHLLKVLNKKLEELVYARRQAMITQNVPKSNGLISAYNPTSRPLVAFNSNYTVPGSAHTTSCIECLSHPPPAGQRQPQFSPDFIRSRSPHYPNQSISGLPNSYTADDRPCGQTLAESASRSQEGGKESRDGEEEEGNLGPSASLHSV